MKHSIIVIDVSTERAVDNFTIFWHCGFSPNEIFFFNFFYITFSTQKSLQNRTGEITYKSARVEARRLHWNRLKILINCLSTRGIDGTQIDDVHVITFSWGMMICVESSRMVHMKRFTQARDYKWREQCVLCSWSTDRDGYGSV